MTDEPEGGTAPIAPPSGGDPVCWLGELCPDCGAFPEAGATRCWRCDRDLMEREEGSDVREQG